MNVVIDTNILISAFYSKKGNPYDVLNKAVCGEFDVIYSEDIYREYVEVLKRPNFNFSEDETSELLKLIQKDWIKVSASISSMPMRDETDRKFYDAAKHSNSYLITGNLKHYPSDPKVVSSAKFLEMQKK